jgi:hypothetical protein
MALLIRDYLIEFVSTLLAANWLQLGYGMATGGYRKPRRCPPENTSFGG